MTTQAHALAPAPARPVTPAPRPLRRACACGHHTHTGEECTACRKKGQQGRATVPPIVQAALQTPGQPLAPTTRTQMEAHLQHDFSQVRVHTGATAAASVEAVDALAYTVGNDVVFGAGHFAPHTPAGRRLLAHELTHVVQNGRGSAHGPLEIGATDAPEEHAAERAAQGAVAWEPQPRRTAAPMLRRQASAAPSAAAPASNAPTCLQPVEGEEIESLLESRVVTVIEFGAEWCHPCRDLKADLTDICQGLRRTPPAVPVRFYTVDIDDERNAAADRRFAPGGVPHLYIYVGHSEQVHADYAPAFDSLRTWIGEAVEHAATSGAARGALTGLKIGVGIGAGLGLALGIGLVLGGVLTGGLGLLGFLGIVGAGAALGLGIGAGIGAIAGAIGDDRDRPSGTRVGFNEAESLIRRRYGRFVRAAGGPLHNARIRPVTQAALQVWNRCRHGDEGRNLDNLLGWTDTGPEPPATIASAADEPTCANGQQLEHATPQRPVIYYATDRPDTTILIHEGLHAHVHPRFPAWLRNYVNEGTTEYFTRQLAREIGASNQSGYDDNVRSVEQLVAVVGEEALQQAYFRGEFTGVNRVLGNCGLEQWSQLLQMGSDSAAAEVLRTRNRDYCGDLPVTPDEPASGAETEGQATETDRTRS